VYPPQLRIKLIVFKFSHRPIGKFNIGFSLSDYLKLWEVTCLVPAVARLSSVFVLHLLFNIPALTPAVKPSPFIISHPRTRQYVFCTRRKSQSAFKLYLDRISCMAGWCFYAQKPGSDVRAKAVEGRMKRLLQKSTACLPLASFQARLFPR